MGFVELFLIAVGLSADAFAVSVCKGLAMRRFNWRHALIIGGYFGVFQAVMPLLGWLLGRQFEKYITAVDHWIAFMLLAYIGGKMAIEAIKEIREGKHPAPSDGCGCNTPSAAASSPEAPAAAEPKLDHKELFMLAVATSIDALAVGITFAFLNVNIWWSISLIGVTTFVISFFGVLIGNRFGAKYKASAELAGGIILVLIGVKILLGHLGIINF